MSQKKSLTNRVATSIYTTCFGNSGYQHLERGMSLSQRAARNVIKMVRADNKPITKDVQEEIDFLRRRFNGPIDPIPSRHT